MHGMTTARVRASVLWSGIAFALILATGVGATTVQAQAVPPARFHGTAMMNGQPAPVGTVVQALVGGVVCGTGTVSADGSYRVDVTAAVSQPGCGINGAPVTFTVGGLRARETGTFQSGMFIPLNLSAATAAAVVVVERWVRYFDEPCLSPQGEWCIQTFQLSPAGGVDTWYRMVTFLRNGAMTQPTDWIYVVPNRPTGQVSVTSERGVARVHWQRWTLATQEPCRGSISGEWCIEDLQTETKGPASPTTWYRLLVFHPNGTTDSPTGFIATSP